MHSNMIRIGWAQGSITPDKPANLFGMFNERISTHVEDACLATALALDNDDGEQAIWMSCDLLNITQEVTDDLRKAVATRIPGFTQAKLLVSCTHTHNAPNFHEGLFPPPPPGAMTATEYRAFFIEQAADIAVQAWESRCQGQVAPALGHAVIGWCRRAVFADGTGQMYGKTQREDFVRIEGPMDPGIELLFTHDMTGTPTGAVVSIACTPQTCMGEMFLSADFWGPARRKLREHFGGNFTVLAIAGAAGDQCPDDLIRWGRSEKSLRGLDACAALARRLAIGVIEGYETGRRDMTAEPVLRHTHRQIALPEYAMTAEQTTYYEHLITSLTANGEPDPSSWNGGTLLRARNHLKRHAAIGPDSVISANCNFIRIGDMAIATNPFELYLEYGQRIKARCPATQTIAAQLSNDKLGYLPTQDAVSHGHYSAMPSNFRVGPQGGDLLVARSLDILNDLFKEVIPR